MILMREGQRWTCALDQAGDVHCIPEHAEEEHEADALCACCEPVLEFRDPVNGRRVWRHVVAGDLQ